MRPLPGETTLFIKASSQNISLVLSNPISLPPKTTSNIRPESSCFLGGLIRQGLLYQRFQIASCIPKINRSRKSGIVLCPSESRRIVKCAVNRKRTIFKHNVYGITCIRSRMNRQSHLMHRKSKSCYVYRKSNTFPITQSTSEIKRIIIRFTHIGSQMHKSLADSVQI